MPFTIPPEFPRALSGVDDALSDPSPLRHAAVVALILNGREEVDEPRLVLIERSNTLRSHAGQLAFPGGKPEPHDRDLLDTALREAEEEVGLRRRGIEVLGRLETVPTPTGFMIVPYVALAPRGWEPRVHSSEVRSVLTPTLVTLTDPSIHRVVGERTWNGRVFRLHEFAIHDPPLWGATARMVRDLLDRMQG